MLDCNYFKKTEFDFEAMVSEFDHLNMAKVAKSIGISYPMAQQYISTEEKYAHIRVPVLFIDAVAESIQQKKNSLELVNKTLDKI